MLPDRATIEDFLTKKLKEEYQNFADIRIIFDEREIYYDESDYYGPGECIPTYIIQYRDYTKSGRISNWKTLYL